MWACRSFLRRPRAAALSQLHPVRRHANKAPVVLSGGAASRVSGGRRTAAVKAKPAAGSAGPDPRRGNRQKKKQFLYLVLDDAKCGAGIHKLDMDDDPNGGAAIETQLQRLPDPPLVRIDYSMGDDMAVLGRHVIILVSRFYERHTEGDTVTFDTKTSALAVLQDLPEDLRTRRSRLSVATSNRLYVLCLQALHVLREVDTGGGGDNKEGEEKLPAPEMERWVWSGGRRYDEKIMPLSFAYGITAHAVHPRGRAIFVSAHNYYAFGDDDGDAGLGTSSYDTERSRWTRQGDWNLPFVGQAHYVASLRAWVGLHGHRDDAGGYVPDGRLCSCDVPRLGRRSAAAPGWKLGKEKLFRRHPKRQVHAKLVHIRNGRFCLVEILTREGVSWEERLGDGDKCVLHLTTFRVQYDDGELLTIDRRPARSYQI